MSPRDRRFIHLLIRAQRHVSRLLEQRVQAEREEDALLRVDHDEDPVGCHEGARPTGLLQSGLPRQRPDGEHLTGLRDTELDRRVVGGCRDDPVAVERVVAVAGLGEIALVERVLVHDQGAVAEL